MLGSLPMPTQVPWVSVDEVAKHQGIAKDTVFCWIEPRGLPARGVGRLWKFKLNDGWVRASGWADHADSDATGAEHKP